MNPLGKHTTCFLMASFYLHNLNMQPQTIYCIRSKMNRKKAVYKISNKYLKHTESERKKILIN